MALHFGYKKLLLSCFVFLTVGFLILGFVRSYYLFIAVSFLLGFGSGIYIPCGIPLLTAVFPKSYWGRAISIHETAAGCAILTIPFITAFSLLWMTWYATFWLMAGMCSVTILLIYAFSPDPQPFEEKKTRSKGILHRKQFWMLLIVFITCGIASMGIFNIVPLFLVKERGIFTGVVMSGAGIVGPGLSPIILGAVADIYSFSIGIFAVGVLTTISTICVKYLDTESNQ